jgi:hypothetical protein
MKREDLIRELEREGVSPDAYSLDSDRDERHCLVRDSDGWSVYYSERGRRNDEIVFKTRGAAQSELYERLLRDDASRVTYRLSHRWPGS